MARGPGEIDLPGAPTSTRGSWNGEDDAVLDQLVEVTANGVDVHAEGVTELVDACAFRKLFERPQYLALLRAQACGGTEQLCCGPRNIAVRHRPTSFTVIYRIQTIISALKQVYHRKAAWRTRKERVVLEGTGGYARHHGNYCHRCDCHPELYHCVGIVFSRRRFCFVL